MIAVSQLQIAEWVGGALIQGRPSSVINSISTDSRKVVSGQLFVALKGESFDAHHFLSEVAGNGASAILVSELPLSTESFEGGIIRVKDTLAGLQAMALNYRRSNRGQFVVGVTGSNGKTSSKDFLSAVLEADGQVNKTNGNLNNHIGLPLTILSGSSDDQYGVWEMGMNHPGEIEVLAEIAQPDAAVITHIGTAHIEHMKTREAIAAEKACLPAAVSSDGFCVMPQSDEYFSFVGKEVACEMVGVGFDGGDVQAHKVVSLKGGRTEFTLHSTLCDDVRVSLPVRGRHMVMNALLAAAVGLKRGISASDIAEKLSTVEITAGRLQELLINGVTVLDDSYNANPDSMQAALLAVDEENVIGRKIAVFGFMGELGEHEEVEHRRLGERVVESGVEVLITVGERAALINEGAASLKGENLNFTDHGEAAEYLRRFLKAGDLLLVKGSRAAAMEKVITLLN